METLEQELMDAADAKEIAHDLPEGGSVQDLKPLLPSDFCDRVHAAASQLGFLSEHEWRPGPMLLVRFLMGPTESAEVPLGEDMPGNALSVAEKLDETVKIALPEDQKNGIRVWHNPPVLDRWNEQWVFETLMSASDHALQESAEQIEFARPPGLSEDGLAAWVAVVNILKEEKVRIGEKVLFTPEEWQHREGESLGAELIVLHENGDHCPYFNLNYQGHLMHAKMDLALRKAGFRLESQTNAHSAIFKAPLDDSELTALAEWAGRQKPLVESDEEDFGDEDKDVFEPGGTRQERIEYLFKNAGLHIKSMVEIPADPGWGDLGKPKRTIESVLQPDPSRPWTMQGNPKMSEFLDFLTRMMSNLGEVLETADVDYNTKWNQELGAWEIKWFIGEPPAGQGNVIESEEDDEDADDAKEVGITPPTRATMPSGLDGWQDYLHNNYANFEEFAWYDSVYGLANRLGFSTAEEAWAANPLIRGSVKPEDFGLAEAHDPRSVMERATQEVLSNEKHRVHTGPANNRQARRPTTPYDVNNGYCEEWAEIVAANLPGAEPVDPGNFSGDADDSLEAGHVFILYQGKFYDAEAPQGVSHWLELPYFTRGEYNFSPEALKWKPGVQEDLNADVVSAAQDAHKDPSDEQKEAGNYQKGHVVIQGLDISIENAKGGMRRGKDKDGKEWEVKLPAHYGYIKGTEGKDKDHIDVFIGGNPASDNVYVVNQDKMEGGFDEHKVMLGFNDKGAAIQAYDDAYSDGLGKKLRGSVVFATMEEFKGWLKDGDHKNPFNDWEVDVEEGLVAYHSEPKLAESVDRNVAQEFLNGITSSEVYNEEEGYHHLPDGTQTGTCTRTAELIAAKFGGRVMGYYHDDNPTAKLGEREGGHDFALIGDRWLVDWWAKNVSGEADQEVFDLTDPSDAQKVAALYGDPAQWKPLEVKEGITGYHASPNKFKEFDTSKEGAHFGTQEQAANVRKSNLRKPIPYSLDIKNPLRLRDIGVWNNFNNLHGALSIGDHITPEQADAVWAAWLRSDVEGWEALKGALEANGYDSIVYQNEQEGPGDSYIALRAGQIHRLKESKTETGVELKLAEVIMVNRKAVPFMKESEEDFDEPEFNEVSPEHEWEPRERPANEWAFYNKETEVGLSIRNEGGGNYYFSLAIPGSVFNVANAQYATDEEAVKGGIDWANRDPVFRSRLGKANGDIPRGTEPN